MGSLLFDISSNLMCSFLTLSSTKNASDVRARIFTSFQDLHLLRATYDWPMQTFDYLSKVMSVVILLPSIILIWYAVIILNFKLRISCYLIRIKKKIYLLHLIIYLKFLWISIIWFIHIIYKFSINKVDLIRI